MSLILVFIFCLQVYPFASVADSMQDYVPRLLLNRDVVGSFGHRELDVVMTGDIIENVITLATALGWMSDLEILVKEYERKCTET